MLIRRVQSTHVILDRFMPLHMNSCPACDSFVFFLLQCEPGRCTFRPHALVSRQRGLSCSTVCTILGLNVLCKLVVGGNMFLTCSQRRGDPKPVGGTRSRTYLANKLSLFLARAPTHHFRGGRGQWKRRSVESGFCAVSID